MQTFETPAGMLFVRPTKTNKRAPVEKRASSKSGVVASVGAAVQRHREGVEDTHAHRSTRREVERRAKSRNKSVASRAGHHAHQATQYVASGGEENPGPRMAVWCCAGFLGWYLWTVVVGVAVVSFVTTYPSEFACVQNETVTDLTAFYPCVRNMSKPCARAMWALHVAVRHARGMPTLCSANPDVFCRPTNDFEVARELLSCYFTRLYEEQAHRARGWMTQPVYNRFPQLRLAYGTGRVVAWFKSRLEEALIAMLQLLGGIEPNPGPHSVSDESSSSSRCFIADLSDGPSFIPVEECPNRMTDFYFTREALAKDKASTDEVEVYKPMKGHGKRTRIRFICRRCGARLVDSYSETKVKCFHQRETSVAPLPRPSAPPSTPEHCDVHAPGSDYHEAASSPVAVERPPRAPTPAPPAPGPVSPDDVRLSLQEAIQAADRMETASSCSSSHHSSAGDSSKATQKGSSSDPPRNKSLTGIIIRDTDIISVARTMSWVLSCLPVFAVDVQRRLVTMPYEGDDRLVTVSGVRAVTKAFDIVHCQARIHPLNVALFAVLSFVISASVHWVPGIAVGGYCLALMSLTLNPVRFSYVPHLASCALVEFSHQYKSAELKAAIHLRLIRCACFPLRDSHAVSLIRGTEMVVYHVMASDQYFYDQGEPFFDEGRSRDSLLAEGIPALLLAMTILSVLVARPTLSEPAYPSSL